MPDPLELPRPRSAVIPKVVTDLTLVSKVVADRRPVGAAVVGTLDHLPEPPAGLRRVEPVGIDGRPVEVVDLPATEVWPVDLPVVALAVGGQYERALARADQD